MPEDFDSEQYFAVLHRENFFGKPGYAPGSGLTASWDYRAANLLFVVRPDDGQAPVPATITCPVCSKRLTLRVRSIADTRRRRRALRWSLLGTVALLVVAVILVAQSVNAADAVADGEESTLAMVGVFAGLALAVFSLGAFGGLVHAADQYFGVSGAGSLFAVAKHQVQPVQEAPPS